MAKKKDDGLGEGFVYLILGVAALALSNTLWKEHKAITAQKAASTRAANWVERRW